MLSVSVLHCYSISLQFNRLYSGVSQNVSESIVTSHWILSILLHLVFRAQARQQRPLSWARTTESSRHLNLSIIALEGQLKPGCCMCFSTSCVKPRAKFSSSSSWLCIFPQSRFLGFAYSTRWVFSQSRLPWTLTSNDTIGVFPGL